MIVSEGVDDGLYGAGVRGAYTLLDGSREVMVGIGAHGNDVVDAVGESSGSHDLVAYEGWIRNLLTIAYYIAAAIELGKVVGFGLSGHLR